MRIAFYAPLKAPDHATPSGDRRVGALLLQALRHAHCEVELVSRFSSYEKAGDSVRQASLRDQGQVLAQELKQQWRTRGQTRPDLWFTYHTYHKAPDWLGPAVSAALGIPYVIAEASVANKRAQGPWALGYQASVRAVASADLVLCPSRDDLAGVRQHARSNAQVLHLAPFLDATPYNTAYRDRSRQRSRLAKSLGLSMDSPWILAVAMMRHGDKLASYRALAASLRQLLDLGWSLLVAGGGPARAGIETALHESLPNRCHFLGELGESELAPLFAACDLFAWPAVNEAYGMAMLEAQAAGLPVVSSRLRGVPDVVIDGRTGLLAADGDTVGFASRVRALLTDPTLRIGMGADAAHFVASERSLEFASGRLRSLLDGLLAGPARI